MGIPGLTTYIANHSDRYLEYYELHDTYLVIDGNSMVCQLYVWHAACNCAFGGDYDKYAKCVSNFFDELLMCNVTPLVLIDGGCEDKKLQTIISRTRQKIELASYYTPSLQSKSKFLPLLLKEVFKDVMKEKNIKYAQCLFEADNTIAAIARILNCPVLSYDSDFYIYGSLYIPFNTWESKVAWSSTGAYRVKRCKIYYAEKLFRAYNGLNQSLLPLAAVLLGNDYVKRQKFKNFFRYHLKMTSTGRRTYNDQQRRIDATFHWLRKRTLSQAVTGILSRLRKTERKYVLNIIETIINGYINASLSVLRMLNVPAHKFSKACVLEASRTYKFEGDIYNLTHIDQKKEIDWNENSDDEADDQEIISLIEGNELTSNESLVNSLPKWFIDEFKLGRYPSYFIDMIVRKLYVCPAQIENYVYAPSIVASLKIVNVIYGLLITGVEGKKTNIKYIARDENKKMKRYQLEYCDSLLGCKLPTLSNLRELPIVIRKEILNSTLGIDGKNSINEIPSNWMLYIATIKYWLDQQEEPHKLACHVYSLLFAMLFNIIDHQLGFYRNPNKFHHKYNAIIRRIQESRKICNYQPQYSVNQSIMDAYREIKMEDCLLAASFFLCNFETDQKLYHQPKKFNITIVHGFAEFQYCLRHSMNLNALLGYPYDQIKVANVFNGTLLYNLCSNFKSRNVVEVYINTVLQNSPSLLHFFNVLLSQVKPLFATALEWTAAKYKKSRSKRYKRSNTTQEEDHEKETQETQEDSSDETAFHDLNNPFSVLGSTP